MTPTLIIIVAGFLAAFLAHDRALQRQHQRLTDSLEADRKAWTFERRELLNRIKPETAQYAPVATDRLAPPAQPQWDDDQGYWQAQEAIGAMSVEELADAMMEHDRQMAAKAA